MKKVFIGDLTKSAVLAALYNGATPKGLGFLHYNPSSMTAKEAEEFIIEQMWFESLNGRMMVINISCDEIDTWGYDRHNGTGALAEIISTLREEGDVNAWRIRNIHLENMSFALERARYTLGRYPEKPQRKMERTLKKLQEELSRAREEFSRE